MKTKRTIRNCPLPVFRQVCPKTWESLTPTDQASVRHCAQCDQNVYLCSTDKETLGHARAGHCVAREIPDSSELPAMYVGQPTYVPPHTAEQDEALRLTHRERGINDALKNLRAIRSCPRCHYPSPSWRTDCRVCGCWMGRMSQGDGTKLDVPAD
ncbi:MAG: hypothetical protein JWO31_2666 [Phycisphaerales bacterium]|nr:hypothetical protein [Phycisphaerales bacterium]